MFDLVFALYRPCAYPVGLPHASGPTGPRNSWSFSADQIVDPGIAQMAAIHKMAPVGVCGALLHTGPSWMYGWLRETEKNSPSESYFLLLLFEYAQGDTYRRSLCAKNLKNQARERVRARFFYFFRIDDSDQCGTQNNVQHCRVACTVTRTAVVGGKRHLRLGFVFPTEKSFTPSILAVLGLCLRFFVTVLRPPRESQIWLTRYNTCVQR